MNVRQSQVQKEFSLHPNVPLLGRTGFLLTEKKKEKWRESEIGLDREGRLGMVAVGKWMEREIVKEEKTGRNKNCLMSLEEKSIWNTDRFVSRKCRKRWWSCRREGNSLRSSGFSPGSNSMLMDGKSMACGDWRSVLAGYSLHDMEVYMGCWGCWMIKCWGGGWGNSVEDGKVRAYILYGGAQGGQLEEKVHGFIFGPR